MAKQTVNLGTSANKGDGDPLRTAFDKVNDNFTELYPRVEALEDGNVTTDVVGSIFGDDSTLLVDGVNNLIPASVISGTLSNNTTGNADTATTVAWTGVTSTPTTLAGYGITDAMAPGTVHDGDITGSVFGDDSTLLVDGVNNTIPKANIEDSANWDTAFGWGNHTAGGYAPQTTTYTKTEVDSAISAVNTLDGDLTGSLFADDSTLLVDGVAGKIVGTVDTASLRTSDNNIALGNSAGFTNQGAYGIALGFGAGDANQGQAAISIGYTAGQTTQGASAIAIGPNAGNTNQGLDAVAIGVQTGLTTQGASSVAIGQDAGQATQGTESVAIGKNAGKTTQGTQSVAIGADAAWTGQGVGATAVGYNAGAINQGTKAVAYGPFAGGENQGIDAVAIGEDAGRTNQGAEAVAIGMNAADNTQGARAVAIGFQSGKTNQGVSAVSIGDSAGETNQAANSIVINATGAETNNTTANSLVIKPIRSAVGTTIMMYDVTSGEITHNASIPYPANAGVVWDGLAPTTVDGAIDRLALYTQDFAVSTDAHWADPNPAEITDAINRLAAAIYALNGNTGI